MTSPLKIFVGFDSRETAAFAVLSHSIIPLVRDVLANTLAKTFGSEGSTEHVRVRFLTPFLSGYEGISVFMDADMLVRADIHTLLDERYRPQPPDFGNGNWRNSAVFVCQHEYTPRAETKMDGQIQKAYPKKNWSSLILFDNEQCKALTPEYVATASLADLHRFAWLEECQVGSLPLAWNHLVGEYPKSATAKILHYTLGLPTMRGYEACDHAEDWYAERELMLTGKPFVAAR